MSDIRVNITSDSPVGVNLGEQYNYDKLTNKPSINGVTLTGNKTSSDLHITGETWELIKSGSVQSGDYVSVQVIDKDTQGNDFSLKKFILYVSNITKEDGTTTVDYGRIYINDVWFLAGSLCFQPNYTTKLQAEYIGVGAYKWNVLVNANLGGGNNATFRNTIATANVGLATKFQFQSNIKMYFDYELYGVRNES